MGLNMEEAIRRFYEELLDIREVEKCKTCVCFYEALTILDEALGKVDEKELQEVRRDVAEWKEECERLKLHGCLGCNPCLPVRPSNEFYEALNTLKAEIPSSKNQCTCELVSTEKWPPVAGTFLVGNESRLVAVCTLSSDEIFEAFRDLSHLRSVAIVGKLFSENIGIEKIILNVISNPNIRFLILCGRESQGHYAGQAMLSLAKNGADDSCRIIGANGARPYLRNVSKEQIKAFRKQVNILDLIDSTDFERVWLQVKEYSRSNLGPFHVKPFIYKPAEVIANHDTTKKFIPDPSGFFIILVEHETEEITVENYSNDYTLQYIIKGKSAEDICATITKLGFVSRLDHAAYLGRELQKAEDALKRGFQYEQEKV